MMSSQYTAIGYLIIKILVIIAMVLYAMYAGIMVRQEQLMAKVLAASSEKLLRLLTIIHLAASVFVIVLALILL